MESAATLEAAVKHALFLMMVRLDADLRQYPYEVGDDLRKLLVPAVLSPLAGSEGVSEVDKSFIKEHREDVEMFAQAVIARDTELRTLVLQTQVWLYAIRTAYSDSASAASVLDNPLLKPYEHECPPISGDEYIKLVGTFSESWLASESKSSPPPQTVGVKKKPSSFSTEDMAASLFALTVGTQDSAGLARLKDEIDEVAGDRVSREVVQRELMFLKLSAVTCALTARDVRTRHWARVEEVEHLFIARFKERTDRGGSEVEETFLQLADTRLAAYSGAFQTWLDAPEHRDSLTLGRSFYDFCGVRVTNPIALFRIDVKFKNIVRVVHQTLLDCELKVTPTECDAELRGEDIPF